MAQERANRKFKDLSMSFKTNPLNDDIIGLKNTNAIARSLKNIVFTQPGEKFFNPDFGSRITESLFDNVDDVSALAIEDEIRSSIINFEPRVNLLDVSVNPNEEDNEMNVVIQYEVTGIDVPPQQLEFVLLPTR